MPNAHISPDARLFLVQTVDEMRHIYAFKTQDCHAPCRTNNHSEQVYVDFLLTGRHGMLPQLWASKNPDDKYTFFVVLIPLVDFLVVADFSVSRELAVDDENWSMLQYDLGQIANFYGRDKLHFSIENDSPIISLADKYLRKLERKRLSRASNISEYILEIKDGASN